MIMMAALALAAGSMVAAPQPARGPAIKKEQKVVFIFLTTGPGRRQYEKAEIEKMQAEHIANFKRLHAAGTLSMAGPCADPDRRARGIVLLTVPSIDGLGEYFKPDPYIQEDLLRIEAFECAASLYELGTPDEAGIEQHTVAVLEQPDAAGRKSVKADAKRYASLPPCDRPAVAIAARKPGKVRLVMFFRTDSVDAVKALVDADPQVVSGKLKAHVWKQWLGKGTLAPATAVPAAK